MQAQGQLRITPAGAGKTTMSYDTAPGEGDHPRRCGENAGTERYYPHQLGSPPQVRGKPWYRRRHWGILRITPAGAGKTMTRSSPPRATRDHPRRCGENLWRWKLDLESAGSPPQVRGKLVDIVVWVVGLRITPAGAGKTSQRSRRCSGAGDHPRRCGEN